MKAKPLTAPFLLVGSSVACPDIQYASGFRAHDPVVFIQTPRRAMLVVPDLEFGRALGSCRDGVEVVTPRMLKLTAANARRISGWAVGAVQRYRVKRVYVPPDFPFGVANALTEAGIRVRPVERPLLPERSRKRADELAFIAESQQAAVIAMRAAIDLIASSTPNRRGELVVRGRVLSSEQVRRRIGTALIERDCFCDSTIVAGGTQSAEPHELGSGPLRAGQPIVIDIFPQHLVHGYWGDLTRTVARGAPPEALARMYRAVESAHAAALGRLRPGVKASTVHRAAAGELARHGFETTIRDGRPVGFIHSTGHGLGLAVHEEPRVSLGDERLKSGHVITIEPGLYYPELGGIRIEDTVVITSDGWRFLCPCETRLVV